LPVIHVYGQLGSLNDADPDYKPFTGINFSSLLKKGYPSSVPYQMERGTDNANFFTEPDQKLFQMAMRIQTYTEVYDSQKAALIQEKIHNAERTFLFGFSFQPQNMDILFNGKAKGWVDATSYQLGDEIARVTKKKLRLSFESVEDQSFSLGRKMVTILDYLQNHRINIKPLRSVKYEGD
jgi:hypothetical protein